MKSDTSFDYYHCFFNLCKNEGKPARTITERTRFERKIEELAEIFCLNICSYAVLPRQYHLVVRADPHHSSSLSETEIVFRWSLFNSLPSLIQDWLDNKLESKRDLHNARDTIKLWRQRLFSPHWFVRKLNRYLRTADKQKYHSYQKDDYHYRCRRLSSEKELLVCLGQIDLCAMRAVGADVMHSSRYTALSKRLQYLSYPVLTKRWLLPFKGDTKNESVPHLPFTFSDYHYLICWSVNHNFHSRIFRLKNLPRLLEKYTISPVSWLVATSATDASLRAKLEGSGSVTHSQSALEVKEIARWPYR